MDKKELITILEDWNFWKQELETGVLREGYLKQLVDIILERNFIAVITGARRSGKSFLMRQAIRKLIQEGTPREETLMINFEDPRLIGKNVKLLEQIVAAHREEHNPRGAPFLFLDEIQEVEGWERWVRTTQELGKATIVLSGSNSKLLGREAASALTGRHRDITVFPLSFQEYLKFHGVQAVDHQADTSTVSRGLRTYQEHGSFPAVARQDPATAREVLLSYFTDIIERDVIKRYRIRKAEGMKQLAKFYLTAIASPITYTSLEDTLGLAADTIEKFSGYLENAYLVFFLKRFSFKVREQEKSPRKVYAVDTGLANAAGFRFSEDAGRIAENIVFLELARRRSRDARLELYYWKDPQHREVDFIVKEGTRVTQAMQVCSDLSIPATRDREIKSLLKAMQQLSLTEAVVVTGGEEGEERVNGKTISFIPLEQWLLK